ncbi:protein COFACTOR ASSEMBLY OF COMPLEX C SUBUNIT B CCB4, chloroplastic-like isoform X2 [Phoenix dactylifera]|uniref:Protein COFACTOR ASSEMBLY OF COMPLEX C SUBUNIT B CCB4, chloroplastic-like isoform X2 n=1 Tax=Phoenix dactylifera TaxID=42345 RepID=A0A8B7MVM5_PHODC|nr:protein COFACTOR ASSEMBLY OF COMPLEX C SUBUNIT B CCB4, chloroplastic-like isoform X2 [Phoenix dactylifera]
MEVGCLLLFRTLSSPLIRPPLRRHSWPVPSSPLLRASSSPPPLPSPPSAYPQGAYRGPKPRRDLVGDWVSNNDGFVRSLPIFVGGLSLLAVLLNRAFSGIAPVTDASSSQSRADILTLALAVTNLLSGLVWLSIRPKYISPVVPQGVDCKRINSKIANYAVLELLWAWESLSATTCCRSLVVVHGGFCLLQIGVAAESLTEVGEAVAVDVHKLIQSSVYRNVAESGKRRELFGKPISLSCKVRASLLTYYYTVDIFQAVILQPLGNSGIAIIGGDTIRGFTDLDQAWITLIAEKLDVTLSKSQDN